MPGSLAIPPEIIANAVVKLAAKWPQRAVAASEGIGSGTVARIALDNEDTIAEASKLATAQALINVLEDQGAAHAARLADARAAPGESKTAPQSFRVAYEAAGLIGGIRDVTINGDVDARSVSIDARRIAIVQGDDLQAIRAQSAELARKLGLNA